MFFLVKNLDYVIANDIILSKLNFSIDNGSHLIVSGPSGSGKSTLINLMSGLLRPTSGNILLDDKVLDKDQTEFSFKYLDNKEYQINVKDYKINQLIKYQENNGIYKYNSETRGDLYIQLLRSNTETVIKH